MVCSYNRKTNRRDCTVGTVNAALKFVQDDGHSLREAQEQFGVNYRTLSRYINSKQDKPILQKRHLDRRCQEKHFQIILKI